MTTVPPIIPPPLLFKPSLECPYCSSHGPFRFRKELNTQGWICLLLGGLLAPVLIGIPMVVIAFIWYRERRYSCDHCLKHF